MSNRVFLKIAAIMLALWLPKSSMAQASDIGNWLVYIGSKKIDDRWNIHHEIQYRNYNMIGDLEQLLIRGGIGYNLSEKNNNLLMGYGYIKSDNYVGQTDEKISIIEHRLFQQFIHKHSLNKLGLQHRLRFEERFVASDFRMRFRYFMGLGLDLKTFNEGQSAFYLSFYDEIFLNTSGSIYDRNRTYFGLGYRLSSNLKLELGYMNQFFSGSSRDQINLIFLHKY